ncbi:MAG: hypothetical protein WBS19_18270 [Candidatus Korobacteraceae bacterium]|jgi:hypothetical protein
MDPLRKLPGREGAAEEATAEQTDLQRDPAVDAECAELLHGLNNVLVSTLLNAQVMEWKLPSYSRLRRNLHAIERNAQRGGELVKQLLFHLGTPDQNNLTHGQRLSEFPEFADDWSGPPDEISVEEPSGRSSSSRPLARTNGTSSVHGKKVPHTPV